MYWLHSVLIDFMGVMGIINWSYSLFMQRASILLFIMHVILKFSFHIIKNSYSGPLFSRSDVTVTDSLLLCSLLPASILCLTRRSGGGHSDPRGQLAIAGEASQQASPSDTLELPEEAPRRESTHSAKSVSIELGERSEMHHYVHPFPRHRQRSASDVGDTSGDLPSGESALRPL